MSAILLQLPNILLALDSLDSIAARLQKVRAGMAKAIEEKRDLTADELASFRDDAEQEDGKLALAIDAARAREAAAMTGTKLLDAGAADGMKMGIPKPVNPGDPSAS